ncbi:hypothetical protein ACHQM5_024591 [Ranunculus cassubicifolius]
MATASSDSLISSSRSSDNLNSSKNRRNQKASPAAPWANIVRAAESELVPAAPSSDSQIPDSDGSGSSSSQSNNNTPDISGAEAPPDISDNSNVAKSKKPAWNKPSNGNGVAEVMGAVSWPALSDSAKASPKSSSESLKALADGSVSASQGPVVTISQQKPVNANANPNLGTNHHPVTRHKSGRRGGGSANNGGSSQLSPRPPPPTTGETPQNFKTSPRDHQKNHVWESGQRTGMLSQGTSGNDHQPQQQQQQQRNSFRRGSGGHHRGDGNNHYSHGNRREQDRVNHDSNPSPRGFNGRDGHMQPRVNQRNFVRPMQPTPAPLFSPPVRPFGFHDMASPVYYLPTHPPESLRAVPLQPFFPGAPFMILPVPDPSKLAKQIEYYFSPENLCKDIFLRKHMDAQGWVPISVIAEFNKVKEITNQIPQLPNQIPQLPNNIPFILDSVRSSTIVEIQGEKIRKRNDWMNWTLQPSPSGSGPVDPLSADGLTNRNRSVEIEDPAAAAAAGANGNSKGPGDFNEDPKAALNRESQH